jgi:hypothetical protein
MTLTLTAAKNTFIHNDLEIYSNIIRRIMAQRAEGE